MNAFARKVRRQRERKFVAHAAAYQGKAKLDAREEDVKRGKVAAFVFAVVGAIAALLSAIAFQSCAHAAVLKISCTAPAWNNGATACGVAPILTPGTDSIRVVIEVQSLGLRDSVTVARGQRANFIFQPVPPGTYVVRAFASRVIGGYVIPGCDTTASVPTIAPAGVVTNLGQ